MSVSLELQLSLDKITALFSSLNYVLHVKFEHGFFSGCVAPTQSVTQRSITRCISTSHIKQPSDAAAAAAASSRPALKRRV